MLINYNLIRSYANLFSFIGAILYTLGRIFYPEVPNMILTIIFSRSFSLFLTIIIIISSYISLADWYKVDLSGTVKY
jgi:hypothetical protein